MEGSSQKQRNDRAPQPEPLQPRTSIPRSNDSALWRRYEEELAYYRADAAYLPLEKCAQRTQLLSALFTLAQLSSQINTNAERRVNA